jgi:hypothetical protein
MKKGDGVQNAQCVYPSHFVDTLNLNNIISTQDE